MNFGYKLVSVYKVNLAFFGGHLFNRTSKK